MIEANSWRRQVLIASMVCALGFANVSRGDFVRGDTDGDGAVELEDALGTLAALFNAAEGLGCEDAADSNDDGRINVSDAIVILRHLFQAGELPNPGPLFSGPDPTCDTLTCKESPDLTPAVVISELMYNSAVTSGFDFVELHNRSPGEVDVGGYSFTNGIDYVIPEGTIMPAGGFLVVAKTPGRFFRVEIVGPYEGELADGGERLTLVDGDCVLESVRYDDRRPWPIGPDGYGPSLERIDFGSPASDHHSWRTAFIEYGTAGKENTTSGIPPRPVIASFTTNPAQPSSHDTVDVEIVLDAPADQISTVTLRWVLVGSGSEITTAAMSLAAAEAGRSVFSATIASQPSQSLVRYNIEVELTSGVTVLLPHEADPRPTLSYFVYDHEIGHSLPLLWLIPARSEGLYDRRAPVSGAVVLETQSGTPLVFDGADLRNSHNGRKLKFLKGEEYRDDRTVNLLPGSSLQEQFGFQVFRDAGAIASWAEWFRVIDYKNPLERHTHRQQPLVQQVNESLLRKNGLGDRGDLYKLEKGTYEKHGNTDNSTDSLRELLGGLSLEDPDAAREFVLSNLDVTSIGMYSVLGVLMANWDGFHNNMFFYHSLEPSGRWMAFPWDLDSVFQGVHVRLPVTYPLDGRGGGTVSREPGGVISRPFHSVPELDAMYRATLRTMTGPGGALSVESLAEKTNALEERLLEDLSLMEAFTGEPHPDRRARIQGAYASIRGFVEERVAFLQSVLAE